MAVRCCNHAIMFFKLDSTWGCDQHRTLCSAFKNASNFFVNFVSRLMIVSGGGESVKSALCLTGSQFCFLWHHDFLCFSLSNSTPPFLAVATDDMPQPWSLVFVKHNTLTFDIWQVSHNSSMFWIVGGSQAVWVQNFNRWCFPPASAVFKCSAHLTMVNPVPFCCNCLSKQPSCPMILIISCWFMPADYMTMFRTDYWASAWHPQWQNLCQLQLWIVDFWTDILLVHCFQQTSWFSWDNCGSLVPDSLMF